jgi:hypothetical protein
VTLLKHNGRLSLFPSRLLLTWKEKWSILRAYEQKCSIFETRHKFERLNTRDGSGQTGILSGKMKQWPSKKDGACHLISLLSSHKNHLTYHSIPTQSYTKSGQTRQRPWIESLSLSQGRIERAAHMPVDRSILSAVAQGLVDSIVSSCPNPNPCRETKISSWASSKNEIIPSRITSNRGGKTRVTELTGNSELLYPILLTVRCNPSCTNRKYIENQTNWQAHIYEQCKWGK